jgi:moderate conductance mechanosensitive channel
VIVMALISRAITGGLRLPADVRETLPLLEDRLNAFVPNILKVMRILVALGVLIAIAQAWQVMDFAGWMATEVGRDLTGRVISAALVVLIALGIWLGGLVLRRVPAQPRSRPRAHRARTHAAGAFPQCLHHRADLIIAAMLALSQLGVNIAPLLAGAGVLGLAIGFGAQKLVQDIITGAFIQVENAMNEGDVVTAGGTTGVVEKLTIRSVGLRDLNGTYHLIPFSSVDMVSNFMKGFGFHVANVGIAYREDVARGEDADAESLRRAEGNRARRKHHRRFRDPRRGGDWASRRWWCAAGSRHCRGCNGRSGAPTTRSSSGSSTKPGSRSRIPHMTLYMGQMKDGTAPPLYLRRAPAPAPAKNVTPRSAPPAAAALAKNTPSPETQRAPPEEDEVSDDEAIRRNLPSQDEADDR